MGLNRTRGPLDGTLRATYLFSGRWPEDEDLALAELVDDPADEYRIQIQIAELNVLNAALRRDQIQTD
jgi:hypothetical protein